MIFLMASIKGRYAQAVDVFMLGWRNIG